MGDISVNSLKALLFDLGGVVIDIDLDNIFINWAKYSNCSVEEIKSKFSFDHFYESHERGEINSSEYFNSLREKLGINISDSQFENGWNSIYKGEIPGIGKLLRKAKQKLPIYAFTNSNRSHHKVWSNKFSEILSLFQEVYNSFDIGKRKPEPEAFRIVSELIGVELNEIVFYDDSVENIATADKLGMNTVHVKSIFDVENSLNNIF